MGKHFYLSLGLIGLLLSTVVFALSEEDKRLIEKANQVSETKHKQKPKPKPVPNEQPKQEKKKHHQEKRVVEVESKSVAPVPVTPSLPAEIAKLDINMVKIKGGCFQMGSPESEPERGSDETQHQVCVKDFQMGKYEVTQAQWQAVMGNNPSNFKGDNLPVETVSWDDVQQFIVKLNQMSGKTYRLPTEAEWEYAARAGTTTAYAWGNSIDCGKANYGSWSKACLTKQTKLVGSYAPNLFGLHDMSGNVGEWTCSDFINSYNGSELECSNGDSYRLRVRRGGSWNYFSYWLRSAYRTNSAPDYRSDSLGFRLSRM